MSNFFKKLKKLFKKQQIKDNNKQYYYNFGYNNNIFNNDKINLKEPETIATFRLTKGAKDEGSKTAVKMFNSLKTKIKNQWFNPAQSINSGWGFAHNSFYNWQQINYYECMLLLQDPLMSKVINTLSTAPLKTFGKVKDLTDEENKKLQEIIYKYKLKETLQECIKNSFVFGGCLLFLDTGTRHNLETPINKTELRNIKRVKIIDPNNIAPVEVNSINPAEEDYMKPKKYFIVGLGLVHSSRFIHFSQNEVPDTLKPMTMYFGFPLTILIKQDVANCNIIGQGIVEMMGRYRHKFMKVPREMFATEQVLNLQERVKFDLNMADNFGVSLLADNEELLQLQTQLSGLRENHEMVFQVLASKTSIPFTELMGTSAKGMDATGEGDRISWYDKIKLIRQSITNQLLYLLYIFYQKENKTDLENFTTFEWETMDETKETEKMEILKSKIEIATNLIDMFGCKTDKVFEWLKQDNLLNIKDLETGEENNITDEVYDELFNQEQKHNDITEQVYQQMINKEVVNNEIKENNDITDKVYDNLFQEKENDITEKVYSELFEEKEENNENSSK